MGVKAAARLVNPSPPAEWRYLMVPTWLQQATGSPALILCECVEHLYVCVSAAAVLNKKDLLLSWCLPKVILSAAINLAFIMTARLISFHT